MSRYLVNLKKGNDYLVPKVFTGVDTTNLIASSDGASSYTATQDCLIFASRTALTNWKLNYNVVGRGTGCWWIIKQNDIVDGNGDSFMYRVYGLKF